MSEQSGVNAIDLHLDTPDRIRLILDVAIGLLAPHRDWTEMDYFNRCDIVQAILVDTTRILDAWRSQPIADDDVRMLVDME